MVWRHVAVEDRLSLAPAPALRKLVPDGPVYGVVADVQSRHGHQAARRLQQLLREPEGRGHAFFSLLVPSLVRPKMRMRGRISPAGPPPL